VQGTRESYEGYGIGGAHVSSAPFRKTKKYSHEGGISTPLIVNWPAGLPAKTRGKLTHDVCHFIDIMPTCVDLAGARFPREWNGSRALPPEGVSLKPALESKSLRRKNPVFWEHEGHRAVRDGKWKLVASFNEPWELYDMEADRVESHDLAKAEPGKVRRLTAKYEDWAKRAGVKPWPMPLK
jgi:arylsulfatase